MEQNLNINEEHRKDIIDAIKLIIGSKSEATRHIELSAWAAIVFYLGGLFAITQLPIGSNFKVWYLIVFVLLAFFTIFIYIHSLYGQHFSTRTEYAVCHRFLFRLINKEINVTKEDCIIEKESNYPKFIQKEITEERESRHTISRIGPWVIYCWFFLKILKNCDEKKYAKVALVESSLYNIILIPTMAFFTYLITSVS